MERRARHLRHLHAIRHRHHEPAMTHLPATTKAAQRGFTLIELMVAMVLGLLVVAAAGSLFMSSRKVYGTTASINRIQENQRIAFEILARAVREAGGHPCPPNLAKHMDTSNPKTRTST